MSIYKASRTIKRKDNSLYNALRSIYEDSVFVGEIAQLWPELPLVANLRCGLWYSRKFHSSCYFKSTDGHQNNWSFNTSRLNLHVALLAGSSPLSPVFLFPTQMSLSCVYRVQIVVALCLRFALKVYLSACVCFHLLGGLQFRSFNGQDRGEDA